MKHIVEYLARALGVWCGDAPLPWMLTRSERSGLSLYHAKRRDPFTIAERQSLAEPLALLMLLGHARELVVDLGKCSTCEGRGWTPIESPWAEGMDGWMSMLLGGTRERRPCLDCRPAEQSKGFGPGRRSATRWIETLARASEHADALAVFADELAERGDSLAPALAAHLRGPCTACSHKGWTPKPWVLDHSWHRDGGPLVAVFYSTRPHHVGQCLDVFRVDHVNFRSSAGDGYCYVEAHPYASELARDAVSLFDKCDTCNGYGTLLGAYWPELEREAVALLHARATHYVLPGADYPAALTAAEFQAERILLARLWVPVVADSKEDARDIAWQLPPYTFEARAS